MIDDIALRTSTILSRRSLIGLAGFAVASALAPVWTSAGAVALAAQPVTLAVVTSGPLPGFRAAEAERYLVGEMTKVGLADWQFAVPAPSQPLPPDRVEWKFTLNPYAGGTLRRIAPMPAVERFFGVHRPISAELRLFLNGEYQTLQFGQTRVNGDPGDAELAAFVRQLTQSLLGSGGAYRALQGGARRPGGAALGLVSAPARSP